MTESVLITGAAAGIGRATARRLVAAGYRVGAYDVDVAGLESLAVEVGGDRLVTGRLDVTDPEEWVQRLTEFTEPVGGALDVLVNNAGILASGAFEDIPLARQRLMVEINVGGVLNGCHLAHRHLTAAARPRVVNLCSASAIYGQAELATYSATKFAVRGLTEALDLEWRDQGIRVAALWPLFVETGMVAGVDIGTTRSLGVRLRADDVAEAVLARLQDTGRRGGVHHGVGAQARALLTSSQVTPSSVLRWVNRRLAR